MNKNLAFLLTIASVFPLSLVAGNTGLTNPPVLSDPRTPPDAATPRINGRSVFGVRPGSPVLYNPIDLEHTKAMSDSLRHAGRDIVTSPITLMWDMNKLSST